EIRGFGSFEIRQYNAYEGRNPRTGAKVDVQPKRLPFFKVGKELKERVNSGRLDHPLLQEDDEGDEELALEDEGGAKRDPPPASQSQVS
ncbi:MAG: HU family DNA-binding protein, partial [Candidatus Fermentibacteraceae bacterium]